MIRVRYLHAMGCLSMEIKEPYPGLSAFQSNEISPIKLGKEVATNSDSFISLPGNRTIMSPIKVKTVSRNEKAILWLTCHLVKDQLSMAFALIQKFPFMFQNQTLGIQGRKETAVSTVTQEHLSKIKTVHINPSYSIARPIPVPDKPKAQMGISSSVKLLDLNLNRLFRSSLNQAWKRLAQPCNSSTPTTAKARLLNLSQKAAFSLWVMKLEEAFVKAGKQQQEQSFTLLKEVVHPAQAHSRLASQLQYCTIMNTRALLLRQVLKNLCFASKLKLTACFKKMTSYCRQPLQSSELECPHFRPSMSDLKVLKNLHNHWLSNVTKQEMAQPKKDYSGFSKALALTLGSHIGDLKRQVLSAVKGTAERRKAGLQPFVSLVETRLSSKLRFTLKRLLAQNQKANLQRLVLKACREFQKEVPKQNQTMTPARIALLAKYFAGEKLIRLLNRRLTSAFHAVRRHSAVESYRGFYSQWWRWKICNEKAKHQTEMRGKLRELSDERHLRMQSEERLTKWMSSTSCQAADSQGKLTERGTKGFYFPKPEIDQFRNDPRTPQLKSYFAQKKMSKRASVSSSMESRGELQRMAGNSVGNKDRMPKEEITLSKTPQGKTLRVEKRSNVFPFFPCDNFQIKITKELNQNSPNSKPSFNVNISNVASARKAPTCSLVDHFKLKIKEPRSTFFVKDISFRENLNESKASDLNLPTETSRLQRLFRTTEESFAAGSQTERLETEAHTLIKGKRAGSQFEFSQTSSTRPFLRSQLPTTETPRTREGIVSSATRKQTLFELWADRRQKNH